MLKKEHLASKVSGNYNPSHNILRLSNLANVRIATGRTNFNIYYNKLGTLIAPQIAKRLKTQNLRKLRNSRKLSNLGGDIVPSFSCRN